MTGIPGYSGDGGPATQAKLNSPRAMVVGDDGSIYISDDMNHVIRRVHPDGMIQTFAGTGVPGFSGDGGPAINANLNRPNYTAIDQEGNIYIADTANGRIRRISTTGMIETVAGTGLSGSSPDGLTPLETNLQSPTMVHISPYGQMVIVEAGVIFPPKS